MLRVGHCNFRSNSFRDTFFQHIEGHPYAYMAFAEQVHCFHPGAGDLLKWPLMTGIICRYSRNLMSLTLGHSLRTISPDPP